MKILQILFGKSATVETVALEDLRRLGPYARRYSLQELRPHIESGGSATRAEWISAPGISVPRLGIHESSPVFVDGSIKLVAMEDALASDWVAVKIP